MNRSSLPEETIVLENPSYDSALVGVSSDNQAIYDYNLMVEHLMKEENMTLKKRQLTLSAIIQSGLYLTWVKVILLLCIRTMTKQERYQMYKSQGICPQCKQPWDGAQVMCSTCRSRAEELRRKKRQQRQAAGICGRCGKAYVIKGTKYCKECATKAKKHKDSEETKKKRLIKYHEHYKPILQQRRIANKEKGLCADCGLRPPKNGVVCRPCYEKRIKWYSIARMRDQGVKCDGHCESCMLPYCIDDDSVKIELTAEEKQLSRTLDKEATSDERHIKAITKRDEKNAKNRYNYALAVIADIESRREQGEIITSKEEKKLVNAQQRAQEYQEKYGG